MDCEIRVKSIAEQLDNIFAGIAYYCPACGETHTQQPYEYEQDTQTCPSCGEDMEQMTFRDYFEDNLGVDVTVDMYDPTQVKYGRIMVAWGGPNIYVDTGDEEVQLFWWMDTAKAPIRHEVAQAIDEYLQDEWELSLACRGH